MGSSFPRGGGGTEKADKRTGCIGVMITGGDDDGIAVATTGVLILNDLCARFAVALELDRDVEEAADDEAGDVDELLDDVVIFRRLRRRAEASDDDDEADELV